MTAGFISIEGLEGAGKTTQRAVMESWVTERFGAPLVTREPGGTPLAERPLGDTDHRDRLSQGIEQVPSEPWLPLPEPDVPIHDEDPRSDRGGFQEGLEARELPLVEAARNIGVQPLDVCCPLVVRSAVSPVLERDGGGHGGVGLVVVLDIHGDDHLGTFAIISSRIIWSISSMRALTFNSQSCRASFTRA